MLTDKKLVLSCVMVCYIKLTFSRLITANHRFLVGFFFRSKLETTLFFLWPSTKVFCHQLFNTLTVIVFHTEAT